MKRGKGGEEREGKEKGELTNQVVQHHSWKRDLQVPMTVFTRNFLSVVRGGEGSESFFYFFFFGVREKENW